MKAELSTTETASSLAGRIYLRGTDNNVVVADYPDGTKHAIGGKTTPVGKFNISIATQGDTGTASQITITQTDIEGTRISNSANLLRVRVCDDGTLADSTNATIAAGSGSAIADTITSTKDLVFSTVAAANATGTLTVSGVSLDGQTVLIGGRTYYVSSGITAVPAENVAIDISAAGTKAAGTLTIAEPVTAGDTMTIGNKGYTFRANGTANEDGEIDMGANEAATKVNIVAAINGTDSLNTAHTQVTAAAFSDDDCVITARYTGVQGDAIASVETFTHESNVFDEATLGTTTAGADATAAQTVTAIAAAITGDASAVVTAVDGAGDTVVVTSKVAHADSNSIATTETMTNGSFGAATLTGGITVRNNTWKVALTDATAETVRLVLGPPPVGARLMGDYSAEIDVTHEAA